MMSVDSTAGSARLWGRGLLLASTALVGFRTRPAPKPTVLHVPALLLRARISRLLTLAVETPAALLARLNPLRVRKVRPAARVGRRKWREATLAVALVAAAPAAQAQTTSTWSGANSNYNTAANWTPNTVPVAPGQAAVFGNTGSATVAVTTGPITLDSWTFNADAQSYTITGARVNFGGAGLVNNATSGTISIANVIGGAGSVQQLGAGTLLLTGVNAYTGGTTVSAGRVIASNTGRGFGSSGTVAISSGAFVELNVTGTNFYTQAPNTFTGAGTIEKTGSGSLTFGGNGGNTNISLSQGGLINVLAGTLGGSSSGQGIWTDNKARLNIEAGATLNTVEAAVFVDALTGAGTYQSGYAGPRTTTIGVAGGTGTFSGTVRDAGGNDRAVIVKTGAGTQTFSGANTYTGGTTFAGGILNAGSAGALGSSGTLSFTGGTLQYSAANRTDYSGRFSTGAGQRYSIDTNGQAVTFATALISSGGSLSKSGAGTLTLSGANTYTGATTISGGTLLGGAANSFSANSAFTVGSGTVLDLNGFNETIGSLSGAGTVTNSGAAAATLSTGGLNASPTFSGVIQNGANATTALTKTGTGTLTLTGANTYTGITTLAGGILNAGSAGALGSAGTLVFTGGTLQYSAANAVDYSNRFSTTAGQPYRIDTNGQDVTFATALFSLSGSLNKFGAGTLTLTGTNTYGGTSTISGGTLAIGVAGGATGTLITSGTTIAPTAGTTLTVNAGSLIRSTGSTTVNNANGAFTINNAGTIDGTSGNTIQNGNTALTLNNSGRVSSTINVSVLAGANSRITNSGTITGGSDTTYGRGVEINGTGGQIINQSGGVIQSAAANPVIFDNGGTLINQLGGTIQHTGTANNNGGAGVYSNGALTLTNGGIITTTSTGASDGVTVLGVATITNTGTRVNGALTGGLIRASNASGLALVGAGSSVTNSGTIQGGTSASFGYGVAFTNTGTVINQTGGLIVGTIGGVRSGGAATITNAGTIGTGSADANGAYVAATTGSANALTLAAGGTVTNQNGGVIDSSGRGISLGAAGTVDNQFGGIIRHTGTADNGTGNGAGVYASGNLILTNAGTITTAAGGGNDGVTVLGVATITNTGTRDGTGTLTGGLIQAANASGIAIAGAGSSVTNSGTIQGGTSSVAVNLNNGGTITNQMGGLIAGTNGGIISAGSGAATITNDGMIRATGGGNAVALGAGGTISNGSTTNTAALITTANGSAIDTTGSAATTVNNYGRIQGTNFSGAGQASGTGAFTLNNLGTASVVYGTGNLGAYNLGSGALTVGNEGLIVSGGTVDSNSAAIRALGTATITNSGTIGIGSITGAVFTANTASTRNAVTLAAGGTITNTGTISGGTGIDANLTSAADITVTGNGSITGTSGVGVRAVSGSGNVVLGTTGAPLGRVSGATTGIVAQTGGNGTIGIVTGGNITGSNGTGISATGVNGAVTVTHTAGTIQATGDGINATSTGAGAIVVNQSGGQIGTNVAPVGRFGIYALGSGGGTTGVTSGTIVSSEQGAVAINTASGDVTVATRGDITTGYIAVNAQVQAGSGSGNVVVTSAANTTFSANNTTDSNPNVINAAHSTSGTGTVQVTNAATITRPVGISGGTAIFTSSGTAGLLGGTQTAITVSNSGTITNNFATGISAAATGAGAVTVDNSGSITVGTLGISATTTGTGSVSVGGTGAVTADAGIQAYQQGVAAGTNAGVTVSGSGATTGNTGIGLDAQVTSAANAGNVLVNRSGQVTAGTIGIRATALGAGRVTVSAGAITTTNGSGLLATGTGGVVAVTANGAITAGGAGNAGVFLTGNNVGNTATVANGITVQGAIGLRVAGTGTTALVNNGTLATSGGAGANAVQIDGGTLVVGNNAGTLTGNLAVVNAGSTLSVDRTADLALANVVTGAGTLNKGGASRLTLTGVNGVNNQFTGTVNITAGTLAVNGTLGDTAGNAATVNVATGATLNGTGTIAGSVNVNTGATVSAGNSPGTLTIGGNYTLNAGSTSLFELGAPNSVLNANNDLIVVRGNLQLGGTLSLVSATNAAVAPVSGVYRLYDYGGTLTGAFGTVLTPPGTTSTASVYTTVPNQVNLLIANANTGGGGGGGGGAGPVTPVTPTNPGTPVTPVNPVTPVIPVTPVTPVAPGGQAVQFWDGADTSGAVAGVQGGSGTWASGTTNWTTVAGDANTAWRSGVGIFSGTAGVVTVAGAQGVQGLQFTTDGYALAGAGTLTLLGDVTSPTRSFVNVDAGVGATIANALTGATGEIGLNKLGAGTLTLAGASTYTGTTQVAAGTLVVAAGGALASAVTVDTGAVLVNAGTLGAGLTNAGSASTSGTVAAGASNTGRLANTGTLNGGLVNATGATTNAGTINGGATIVSGSLTTTGIVNGAVANGGTIRAQGQLNGTVANQAGATFTQTGALTGIGRLTNDGTVDLGGNDLGIGSLAGTNAGARIVNGGTLTTGSDGASTTFAGAITGATALTKTGAGTLTLSGANTSTGTTRVQAGGLINTGSLGGGVGNAGILTNTGSVAGPLANGGTVLTSGTLAGGLSNTGDVTALAGRIDGAVLNNAGTLSITGRVAGNGPFANAAAATLAVSGTYDLAGLLTNAGGLTVASGGHLTAPAGIVNSGAITVAQGGTLTDALANTGRVVNDGTYNADVSNTGPGTLANRTTGVWNGNLTANTASVTNAGLWQGNARNDVGGTLANGGTWTTASAPIANAGTLSNTGTVNGGVANSGGFTNAGTLNGGLSNLAGTTTNTGTINGAVAVAGGSLATTGTLDGALTNAATVTASGRIAGSVTNLAGASFTLTGPLSGVTRLSNDGTVDLGGTALSVGSLSGTNLAAVLRNGTLTAAGDDTTTYAGTITDGAAATGLIKTGTGTLTLTGANTFTGGTTILSGTLVASAANLGGGPVTNSNTLVIDQAGDATLSDTINGTGRFIKQGAGSLTYTGTGTLSGATLVSAGRLNVNGSLANSVVNVASAASLSGTGVVGGVVVNGGGVVAPGASPGAIGTLRVAGNVLFASQSLYQVDATASGQSDRIAASGSATLQGGTVQVTAQPGLYAPSTRYTVLTAAGGLTGQFATVTANFAFLTPTLAYGNTDVTLQLARNDIAFGTTAQTRNQGAVAAAAQATGPGARLYDAIAVLSAPQSRAAYDALSGEIHASAVTAQFETATLIREAVLDRLRWGDSAGFGSGLGSQGIGQRFAPGTTVPAAYTADLPGRAPSLSTVPARFVDPQPITAWGQGFGAFGSTATNGNAARLDRQTSGFVLGADARVENDWRIGAAGGYTVTNVDITGRLSTGSVESGYGALYAGGGAGPLQVRLGASYGGNSLTTRRAVIFAGLGENAGARYGGSTAQGFAEAGYRFGTALGTVEPFLGGAVIRIGRNAFNETGGTAALTAAGRDYDLATSTVGVRAEAQLGAVLGSDLPILVRALVGYRRAYGDVVPSALFTVTGGQSFVAAGIPIDRDALVTQAGLDWQVARGTTLGVAYTGQVGTRAQDHGVKGNFTLRF